MLSWFRRSHRGRQWQPPPTAWHRFSHVRGRRVVTGIPYLLPKDDEEISRLDFQHFMLKSALGGLYRAPIQRPMTILDVATGTGRWAIEMARDFPRAIVTGLDLVPPPADDATIGSYAPGRRPTNYVFQQGNIFNGLPFESGSFDFVHMRLVYGAVPLDRWPPLVTELMRVTKSGGWIELVEGYVILGGGPATNTILNAVIELSNRRGIDATIGKDLGTLLRQGGAQSVQEREVHIPIGRQHGRLGGMAEIDTLSVFKALGNAAVASDLLDAEEFALRYEQMTREFASPTSMTLWPVFQAFGRKPRPIHR